MTLHIFKLLLHLFCINDVNHLSAKGDQLTKCLANFLAPDKTVAHNYGVEGFNCI